MQLKVRRSQQKKGVVSKSVKFLLTARLDLSQAEKYAVDEYKLGDMVIYNSEQSQKHLDGMDRSTSAVGTLARMAMAKMSLNLTINNLTAGKTVECSTLDEVIAAEESIKEACENVKAYIEIAQTFDGREETFEF